MTDAVIFKWRGWLSAAVILPAVVVACLSEPMAVEGDLGDVAVDFVAWLVLGAGVFVRLWATLYIGGHKSHSLVTEGPYAFCRHPLYIGSFLITISLALFLDSPIVLAATLVIAVFYALVIVPSEERHAASCFGPAYATYCSTTRRFWPRLSSLGRPGKIEVKMAEFLREYSRTFGFIAIGAAAEFLAYCRGMPWWPRLFHLP